MSEEIENLLTEFRAFEEQKAQCQEAVDRNEKIVGLKEWLRRLQEKEKEINASIEEKTKPYNERIESIETQQETIKTRIIDIWNIDKKTYHGKNGTVTLRTTRSLSVVDSEKVVDFLTKNNKIKEGIKSFNLRILREAKNAKLLPDDTAKYEERNSVQIKLNKDL